MRHNHEDIAKWLRLHMTDQIGSVTFARLLEYFGDIDHVLGASISQLMRIRGISQKKALLIATSRDKVDVDAELELAEKLDVKILTIQDPDYPPLLRQITDPPHVLYVKGDLIRNDKLALAVVGSRVCSHYGQEQSSRLSHLLASAGFTIVSGLARGIDSSAHRGALAANGRTLAVQGCGLAQIYPPENADLAQQITQSGALISELPLTFEPIANNFPARNRIISGLSLGTLVVEARQRSGAQITARLAMEQNREVMAVPGRIDAPGSAIPHQLIRDGAKLVEGIDDIMEALGHIGNTLKDHADQMSQQAQDKVQPSLFDTSQLNLTPPELKIIDYLEKEPTHIDQIITATTLSPGPANAALTSLQLKGVLRQLPGSYYQKMVK